MGLEKRVALFLALSALAGCAATHPVVSQDCSPESARALGRKAGRQGKPADSTSLSLCPAGLRSAAQNAYRDAYSWAEARRSRGREKSEEAESESVAPEPSPDIAVAPPPTAREPAALGWVCEVEANAKVFTGVGGSRGEALLSAQSTCGSHFQASSCTKADCRQSL